MRARPVSVGASSLWAR